MSMLDSSIISAPRFIEGGAPMFAQTPKNRRIANAGDKDISPFLKARLRVFVLSYMELAVAKSVEEAKPWATIIKKAPVKAQWENIRALARSKAMWLTEA